jgi:hypothetical protein
MCRGKRLPVHIDYGSHNTVRYSSRALYEG